MDSQSFFAAAGKFACLVGFLWFICYPLPSAAAWVFNQL